MAIVNGQKGAYPQPSHFGRSEAGAYTVKVWEGTLNEVYAMAAVAEASGGLWEVTESYTGAKHRIEVRFPIDFNTTETPVDGWEAFGEEVEKDLLEADILGIDTMDNGDKAIIRAVLDNGVNSDDSLRQRLTDDPFSNELYNEVVYGLKGVRHVVQHLRHTQTVSTLWTVRAALTNVGKIISTGSLTGLEGVPTSLLVNLPITISNRVAAAYGWYKKFPTVRISAGHRIQIEQEWEYGLWSRIVYMGGLGGSPI
jgi:hypothetical protein